MWVSFSPGHWEWYILIQNNLTMLPPRLYCVSYSVNACTIRLRSLQKTTIPTHDIVHIVLSHAMKSYASIVS